MTKFVFSKARHWRNDNLRYMKIEIGKIKNLFLRIPNCRYRNFPIFSSNLPVQLTNYFYITSIKFNQYYFKKNKPYLSLVSSNSLVKIEFTSFSIFWPNKKIREKKYYKSFSSIPYWLLSIKKIYACTQRIFGFGHCWSVGLMK